MMTNVLFLHGILGKPDYFDFLRPCVPEECVAEAVLLEGHGGSPQDFSKASMRRWREQVAEAVDGLRCQGDRLLIAAHSMGCLFAIDSTVNGHADGLFLLNPPLSLRLTGRLLKTPLKVVTGRIDDPLTLAAKQAYSISDDRNLLHYVGWIPRYLELFAEIKRVRELASRVDMETRAYFSAHDEMVSPSGARLFPERDSLAVTLLPDSGHYYYSDADRATITTDFADFVRRFAD